MTTYTHKKTAILERIVPINITDYIRQGIFELKRKGLCFNFSHPLEAERLKQLLNDPRNTTFKSTRDPADGLYFWHEQNVTFVRSNLGHDKGAIFYFLCNSCHRRVKFLYEYSSCYPPLCRKCCRLGYKYPTRKSQDLSRILRKPYLSSEDKHWIIKRAGITKEDIPTEIEDKNSTRIANELSEETNPSEPSEPRQYEKKMSLDRTAQSSKQAMAQIIYKKMPINLEYMEI
jgi:hypothetical protein